MDIHSLQISPDEFRTAAQEAKEQQQALEAAKSGTVRTHVGNYHTSMNAQGMQAQTVSSMQTFKADDLARDGIVGSLGAHKQHAEAIVKLPGGFDTSLENAFRMGLVGKDSSGQYFDFDGPKKNEVDSNPQETQQAKPKEDTTEPEFKVPAPALGALAALSQAMPEYHVDQIMETAANHAVFQAVDGDGKPIPLNLAAYAQMTGYSEQELNGHVGAVMDGYQAAADKALRSLGVDTDTFYQFLKDEHPGKLKEAMRHHYFTKDASVWKGLVPLYRSSVLPTDEALQRAGIAVHRRNGESYINYKGTQMTVKAAAKAGLL